MFVKTCLDLPIKSVPCNNENFKSTGANNKLKLKWMSLCFLRVSPCSTPTRSTGHARSSNVDYPVMDSGGRQMLYIGQAGKSKSYGLPCLWPVR